MISKELLEMGIPDPTSNLVRAEKVVKLLQITEACNYMVRDVEH